MFRGHIAHYVGHGDLVQIWHSVPLKLRQWPLQHNTEDLREAASGLGETLGHSLIERIGNTPLLRLDALTSDLPGVALLGKAEWYNPGGSVKDRAAANIVAEAQRSGKLRAGKILLDATSGNTGIAYAMLGAAEGFPVTLCMPENVSRERKQILHGYGANILYTDPADGSDGAIRMARELAAKHPDQYFYADQYSNEANWKAHYHGTANEIWQQTQGRLTHFVVDAGYERNVRGDDAAAEGTESGGEVHLAAAGLVVSRYRRRQAHGECDRAEDLRCDAGG